MSERAPVDKYSRKEYEKGLAHLAQREKAVASHPLQEQLSVHTELQQGSKGEYPFAAEERRTKEELAQETAHIQREIDRIKQDLWRQLSNAHNEALSEDDERESRKLAEAVLPQIKAIEEDTRHRLVEEPLSGKARIYANAIIEAADKTRTVLETHKAIPGPSKIREAANLIVELYSELKRFAGNALAQDRYGNPTGSAA